MKKSTMVMSVLWLGGLLIASGSDMVPKKKEKLSAAEIVEKSLAIGGIGKVERVLKKMKRAPEGTYSFAEKEFIQLGNSLLEKKQYDDAIGVFLLSMELFPDSATLLYHVAKAYQTSGDQQSFYRYFRQMVRVRNRNRQKAYLEKNEGKLFATADEVIEKYLAVTGGRSAWEAVRTMVIKFKLCDTSDEDMVLVRYYKRPGFYRQGVEGNSSFTATDGEKTWRVRDGEWKEVEDQAYRRMGSLDDSMLNYQTRGITYDFIGAEILNHAPVYHLKRTFWDNYQEDLYFSIDSGRLVEKLTPYNIGPTFYTFWDYRKAGDVMIPHVRIRNMDSMGPPHGIVVKEVKINVPLEDSLFLPPEKQ
jgi:tetratricopeptide (TPR) repeat protein